MTRRCFRFWTAAAASFGCALVSAGPGLAAAAQLPNPCDAVPSRTVASALGLKTPPPSTLAVVVNTETCSYSGVKVTVSVGYTAIVNPATPLKVTKVPGLPHGTYSTYAGSTQSQISFYKGTAATGIYGVVRNYGKIRRSKLEKFAKALYAAMAGHTGGGQTPGVHIIG